MARLMSSTELYQRMETTDDFVLVDILPNNQFNKEHIPGAINIPLEVLSEIAPTKLNKNQRIIVYGQSHDNESSSRAAEILEALGYRKVSDFDGGIYAWKRAGYRTSNDA
ncbi:MAG: rhodanese-like domain-containing protein [Myxococcota bacterium]|nr:rhodanese-like domain-containing protein [Myxococcota bacterium]